MLKTELLFQSIPAFRLHVVRLLGLILKAIKRIQLLQNAKRKTLTVAVIDDLLTYVGQVYEA